MAVLPRLPQRVAQTRTPRPAPSPAVAAFLLMPLLAVVPLVFETYWVGLFTEILIFAVLAIST